MSATQARILASHRHRLGHTSWRCHVAAFFYTLSHRILAIGDKVRCR